ncbi:hypothetical protein HMH01_11595 [Halovulum dunhuangense]|uniref:Uncharacterized protein n=1 Tax=Halovulum dunhuangense TaxID=1505036 RepID=A0A849L4F1_9RHOB|nr:hypothetical protein [Halovulum dunhuangense]NNU81080.1 hypothetical protein [Halovulum dunhuangense]
MKTWDSAWSKIRKRRMDVWRELRLDLPFEYDHLDPDAYFSSFLVENPPDDPDIVLERVDRDRLWASEIVITSQKYFHVLRLTSQRAADGHITWAATDAHHAVLLGVRCFLSTLGVCICQGKHRAHLVDLRPERGSPQDEKAFKKAYRNAPNPVRVLTPDTHEMGQKQIFDLFTRLLRTVIPSDECAKLIQDITALKLGAHKSERNRLLYHSHYWHWPEDINWPAIDLGIRDDRGLGAEGLTKDFFVLSLVAKLVENNVRPVSEYLQIKDTFFEPLYHDQRCTPDVLSCIPVG